MAPGQTLTAIGDASPAREPPQPAIIVHGGAGVADPERGPPAIAGCERAARAGFSILDRGGSALDAVEAAVRVLEDDPEFNAGFGSVLDREGKVEVDACIMAGDLRAGAVGAVPWLRHPVTLARRVLAGGEHVLLVGEGALAFGREHGILPEAPAAMISPRARARHEREARARRALDQPGNTVGACALDRAGHVAAATSTGGLSWKRAGRVGDSPLVGAGTYADDEAGAASATGHGEAIMRVVMAKYAVDRMRAGARPAQAARDAVAELGRRTGDEGGIILIGRDGSCARHASSPRMPWAAMVAGVLTSGGGAA